MLVAGFPAGSFAANCYLVATAAGEECVIVDPGQDATDGIDELVREHRLKPVAVILTHGHLDHVWSVAPVCGARDVPAYIHPGDRDLLTDPAKGFGVTSQQLFGGLTLTEPDDVRELADGGVVKLAGLEFTVDHAPGHTPGSVTFRTPASRRVAERGTSEQASARTGETEELPDLMFSGDLLFAGSIGRSDLPGGSYEDILASLARVCLSRPDETVVLPGHGQQTTIGQERATNPYLADLTHNARSARLRHDQGPSKGF